MGLIEVGQPAPDFALSGPGSGAGERVRLGAYRGRWVVLYFYPKNDTAGCTMEACNFRDQASELAALEAAVIGVSPEQQLPHEQFAGKHKLNFPVLMDPRDAAGVPGVCAAYGVWVQKSLYGKKYWGVERTTFLLNPEGVVAKRWDRVRVPGHVAIVMQALKLAVAGTLGKA